jgi:7-keto-8-aminopelargonate synthetase-like enzyme
MPNAPHLEFAGPTHVRLRGRRLLYFAGCDYFRLSSHPAVLGALRQTLRTDGLTVAASRITTGNHLLYARLERELARYFRAEGAVLLSTGYATNLALVQALSGDITRAHRRTGPQLTAGRDRFLARPVPHLPPP